MAMRTTIPRTKPFNTCVSTSAVWLRFGSGDSLTTAPAPWGRILVLGAFIVFLLSLTLNNRWPVTASSRPAARGSLVAAKTVFLDKKGVEDPSGAQQRDPKPDELNAVDLQAAEHFFENSIRPLLQSRCHECHGTERQDGDLRLDSRDALLQGGRTGPAIVLGNPDQSLLLQAVHRTGDLEMPPDEPLLEAEIAALTQWIRTGAVWAGTEQIEPSEIQRRSAEHWAFQPLVAPDTSAPLANVIDHWIQTRLQAEGLRATAPADRRTLLRRLRFVLTGLPPSHAEVEAFQQDPDPSAYESRVEQALSSPQFGEHWARHWLDLARYSDTKGYVYSREERFWTHAWSYRDWVIDAINRDLPYDQFIRLQLAADQIADDPNDLAAMGFLTIGRRFLGVKPDIIDDRIDVVTRGLLGLTVSCARCHDHKYDAIPTADYYSLYGVMASCYEEDRSLVSPELLSAEYVAERTKRQQAYLDQHKQLRDQAAQRARQRTADYLAAQLQLDQYPGELFGQLFKPDDLLPSVVHRWADYLRRSAASEDPIFTAWHRLLAIPAAEFAQQAPVVAAELGAAPPTMVHPAIAAAMREAQLTTHRDVVQLYSQVLQQQLSLLTLPPATGSGDIASTPADTEPHAPNSSGEGIPKQGVEKNSPDKDPLFEALFFGENSPCVVPDEPIVEIEYFVDIASCESLWKLQAELDRWVLQGDSRDRRARVLVDRPQPIEPQIFRRGSPLRKGDFVPRQFLSLLAGDDRSPFENGSGRLELADAIATADNPLTARVMVNRIWGHVFGQPLVATTSDFGLRSELPSHPELLDQLAQEFIEHGWSVKHIVRQMLLSETFRQAGADSLPPKLLEQALNLDPENRLLWHSKPRRLTIEALRDTLLSTSGQLDSSTFGGKAVDLWTPPFARRRSVYGLVDRQFLPSLLRSFDFANPDLHIPWRSETTVAQQCLFFLNHPLVLEQAKQVVEEASQGVAKNDSLACIQQLFRRILQRDPSELESLEAMEFLDAAAETAESNQLDPWQQLAQVLYSSNEFLFIE